MSRPALRRGDLLPRLRVPFPGPRTRAANRLLSQREAPGVNTLGFGPALLWEEARGANVRDLDGNLYLDLTSGFGVAAVGHRHPRVVAAVRAQCGHLLHGLGDVHAHPLRLQLAERLQALAPFPDALVYFAISGSDAVEIALKTALLATRRPAIMAFTGAYHGLTVGSLAATDGETFRAPFRAHLHSQLIRLPYGAPRSVLAASFDRRPDLGCVLVEPILGRGGVVVPPSGWLAELAELCRQREVLLIVDEILTGFGRTGRRFAVEHEEVVPDLLCCGKALGGGLPIAAVLGRRPLLAAWPATGEALHTATFLAHPLACAASLATLDVLHEEGLTARAADLGPQILQELAAALRPAAAVVEVRGRGLLLGIELATTAITQQVLTAARQQGLLLLACGPLGTVLEILPTLSITERQLAAAVERLVGCIRQASSCAPRCVYDSLP